MNPVLLAIVALLVIMAVSIAMAILFPYQDLNAQGSLRGAGKTEGVQVGIISEGIGGSGDIHSAVVQSDGDEKEIVTQVNASDELKDDEAFVVSNNIIDSESNESEKEGKQEVEASGEPTKEAASAVPESNAEVYSGKSAGEVAAVDGASVEGDNAIESESNTVEQEEEEEAVAKLVQEATATLPESNTEAASEESFGVAVGAIDASVVSDNGIETVEQEDAVEPSNESVAGHVPSTEEPAALVEEPIIEQPATTNESDNDDPSDLQTASHHSLFSDTDAPVGILDEGTPADEVPAETTGVVSSEANESTTDDTTDQYEQCRSLLRQANGYSSDILGPVEYVAFLAKLKEKGTGANSVIIADQYADLEYELKLNFVHLSCSCPATNANCCSETSGIYIDDSVGIDSSLDQVCEQTLQAMNGLVKIALHPPEFPS